MYKVNTLGLGGADHSRQLFAFTSKRGGIHDLSEDRHEKVVDHEIG